MFFFSVQVYFCYQYGMGMNNGDIDIESLEKSLHETLLADSSTRCKQNKFGIPQHDTHNHSIGIYVKLLMKKTAALDVTLVDT